MHTTITTCITTFYILFCAVMLCMVISYSMVAEKGLKETGWEFQKEWGWGILKGQDKERGWEFQKQREQVEW